MKSYLMKMMSIVFILSSLLIVVKEKNERIVVKNVVINEIALKSDATYEPKIVYEDLTLEELSAKIDAVFSKNLSGYGEFVATTALEYDVDPVVAASIMLHETGCIWKCSYLMRNYNNVGGMRSSNGYMKFASLEKGIEAFIRNLAYNYYAKGLNTPELINKKYAESKDWYKNIYYYMNLIKEG